MAAETLTYRVVELEKKISVINGDVDSILREKLPALKVQINTNTTLLKVYGSLILAGIGAILVETLTH
jgi:hypothetical protein